MRLPVLVVQQDAATSALQRYSFLHLFQSRKAGPDGIVHFPDCLPPLRVKMSETVSDIEFTEQGEQGFSG